MHVLEAKISPSDGLFRPCITIGLGELNRNLCEPSSLPVDMAELRIKVGRLAEEILHALPETNHHRVHLAFLIHAPGPQMSLCIHLTILLPTESIIMITVEGYILGESFELPEHANTLIEPVLIELTRGIRRHLKDRQLINQSTTELLNSIQSLNYA